MDKLLNETAANVAKQIDSASDLLDVLSLIPTLPDDEFLDFLQSEAEQHQTTSSIENEKLSEEKRQIKANIMYLWELEKSISQCDKHNLLSASESMKKIGVDQVKAPEALLQDATISLAEAIQGSLQTRKFLLQKRTERDEGKESMGLSKEKEEAESSLQKLKDYLCRLKGVVCEDISTSVEKEQQATTELFKLREKCKLLEEEKAKTSAQLEERQHKAKEKRLELNHLLDVSTEALKNMKDKVEQEQDASDKEIMSFLAEEEKKHKSCVTSLNVDLTKIQEELDRLRCERKYELQEMMIQREKLEEKISRTISLYEVEEQKKRSDLLDIVNKTSKEQDEKTSLEKEIALQDLDDSIAKDEQALIQSVIDLESKADAILFNAAAQLQKLYRGNRDRAAVKKLKKKSKKGKKQKGKKSKANK